MTKRERVQLANGTKKPKAAFDPSKMPKSTQCLVKLQVMIAGKGWTDVTSPTTHKVIAGVQRHLGFKYQTVIA